MSLTFKPKIIINKDKNFLIIFIVNIIIIKLKKFFKITIKCIELSNNNNNKIISVCWNINSK